MATRTEIAKVYVATFNRAADADGLAYWISDGTPNTTNLTNLEDIAAAMTESAEYQAEYAGLDREATVTAMYQNLFNRAPDAAGLDYWVNGEGSTIPVNKMIIALINGAQGDDVTIMDNKATVGLQFADAGLNDVTLAKTVMSGVTADPATVTAAEAVIADHLPQTFTLTTGVDTLTGGAGDDTFTADLLTVNNGDTLDGKDGNDTLNMTVNANVSNQVTISNIEDINYTTYGATTVDMTNITGVKNFTVTDSTGTVTLNNQADATTAYGFKGASTNDITVNYKAGTLNGTSDKVVVNADTASNINFDVDAGYENLEINATGANSIAAGGLTVPGVTSLTIKGSGSLNVNNNLSGFSTIDSTGLTGALTSGIANTAGFASNTITGNSNGTAILLGAGDDNVGFTSAAIAGKSDTIKLGAGNDTFDISVASAGSDYVFGEDGDDTIRINGGSLAATDVVDGGTGTDTLVLNTAANTIVLRGVEKLNLTTAATGATVINSADSALTVTAKTNGGAVNVTGLTSGSTVKVELDQTTSAAATAVTVGFQTAEATSTVDIASGMTGALALNNITDATVNLGAASAMTTNNVSTTAVTNLTINAAKAFTQTTGDIVTTDNKMEKLTIDGQDVVTVGDVTSTGLTDVKVTSAKAMTVGAMTASNVLNSVDLNSSDALAAGNIGGGATTTATLTSVNLKAAKAITGAAAIDAVKIGTITAESTGDNVTLGAIGANATELGDVTLTAAKALTTGKIGVTANNMVASDINLTATNGLLTTADIQAKTLGTVSMTSTAGGIAATAAAVTAADTTGITVNMTAKTFISSNGTAVGTANATTVQNTDGSITASIAGDAAAVVNFTTTGASNDDVVNLTATNTGGLESVITQDATAGDGSTSTISLGDAKAGANNTITVVGTVDTLNVNGGTGTDIVNLGTTATAAVIKGGSISADTVSFVNVDNAGTTNGVAINLGSSTVTFDAGTANETTVAAMHAVEYNSAAAAKVVTNGYDFTLNGVSSVIGSSANDYIVANAAGTTITGGAGDDSITLGAGADTVVFGATAVANGSDTITSFTSSSDKIDLSAFETVGAIVDGTGTYTVADGQVVFLSTGNAGDADSAAAAITALNNAGVVTGTAATNWVITTNDNGSQFVNDAAVTNWIVIADDNSTAVYQFVNDNNSDEYTGAVATLIGTIDAVLVSGDITI